MVVGMIVRAMSRHFLGSSAVIGARRPCWVKRPYARRLELYLGAAAARRVIHRVPAARTAQKEEQRMQQPGVWYMQDDQA